MGWFGGGVGSGDCSFSGNIRLLYFYIDIIKVYNYVIIESLLNMILQITTNLY